jgi:hypothetical protein
VGAESRGHRARRRFGVVRAAQVDGQLQRVAPGGGHEHHGRAEAPLVLHPVRGDPEVSEVDLRIGDRGVERGAERGEQGDGVGAAQAGGGADLDTHAPPSPLRISCRTIGGWAAFGHDHLRVDVTQVTGYVRDADAAITQWSFGATERNRHREQTHMADYDPRTDTGIPTENVGSLPRPTKLQEAYAKFDAGEIEEAELEGLQDAAAKDSIEQMEATGAPIVSDGEQRWSSFATYPIATTLAGTGLAPMLGPGGQFFAIFADGHGRQLPKLLSGPFATTSTPPTRWRSRSVTRRSP